MIVYEFLYNSCVWESSFATISLHRTKLGAYKAMRAHLMDRYNKWFDNRILWGKNKWMMEKFGEHERWGIGEQEVLE